VVLVVAASYGLLIVGCWSSSLLLDCRIVFWFFDFKK
jgi:hypothetical protein